MYTISESSFMKGAHIVLDYFISVAALLVVLFLRLYLSTVCHGSDGYCYRGLIGAYMAVALFSVAYPAYAAIKRQWRTSKYFSWPLFFAACNFNILASRFPFVFTYLPFSEYLGAICILYAIVDYFVSGRQAHEFDLPVEEKKKSYVPMREVIIEMDSVSAPKPNLFQERIAHFDLCQERHSDRCRFVMPQ
jgi:hypothetical protein